jgi:DNA-binding LytR/AlgR family response regulator
MSRIVYSVLIVEDESSGVDLLIDYISSNTNLKLSSIARNGSDAINKILTNKYDIVFLDIQLPVKTGLEVLSQLEKIPVVIFTTAYKEHAIKAFDYGAVDYLLKPFSKDRFNKAVERALIQLTERKKNKPSIHSFGSFFKTTENRVFISYDEIIYISSLAKHCIVHECNQKREVLHMIGEIENRLPKNVFNRIHRKYIVNLKYIKHIEFEVGGLYNLFLKDPYNISLPVGRKYIDEIKEL